MDLNILRHGELYEFAISAEKVPEPASLMLLGFGLAGLGLLRRRSGR